MKKNYQLILRVDCVRFSSTYTRLNTFFVLQVIWPSFHVRDLEVWRDLYIDFSFDNQYTADNKYVFTLIILYA